MKPWDALLTYLCEAHLSPPPTRRQRLQRKVLSGLYRVIAKYAGPIDPIVRVNVRGQDLYMNASHDLPQLTATMRYYDTALPRIAAFLEKKQGHLTLIDVGANIGDTVAFIADKTPGAFLCIEGDERYLGLLQKNVRDIYGVVIEHALVSDGSDDGLMANFVYDRGTSRLAHGSGQPVRTTTLDELVAKHPAFLRANLLKVDTDGYDYKVLRGSDRLITHSRPAIYFELSPEHLRLVGHDDPMAIFDFLVHRGYSKALFYDWTGLPFVWISTDDREALPTILEYASIKGAFYYDVLTFHDSQREEFQELAQEERQAFPVINWVTV